MNRRISFLLAFLGSSLVALPVSASIISSYPTASSSGFSLNGTPVIDLAVGFTMGGTAQNLGSATIRLSAVGIAAIPTSVVQASLYGNAGSNPANPVLVTLSPAAGTVTQATLDVVLTPTSPFTLDASTTYWLVVQAAPSVTGNLSWDGAVSPASGSLATYVGSRQSVGVVPPNDPAGGNLIFAIDSTVVPEPGTLSLAALGLSGLALRRRPQRS